MLSGICNVLHLDYYFQLNPTIPPAIFEYKRLPAFPGVRPCPHIHHLNQVISKPYNKSGSYHAAAAFYHRDETLGNRCAVSHSARQCCWPTGQYYKYCIFRQLLLRLIPTGLLPAELHQSCRQQQPPHSSHCMGSTASIGRPRSMLPSLRTT